LTRTRALAVAVAVAAAASCAALAGEESPASAARRGAQLLETRALGLRGAPPPEATALARRSLADARSLLSEGGLDDDLARALVAAPSNETVDQPERALRLVRRRLRAFAEAAEMPPPEVPASARPRLEAILRDPAFRERAQGPNAFDRLVGRLREAVGLLLARIAEILGEGALVSALAVLLVACVAIALVLLRVFSRGRSSTPDLGRVRGPRAIETADVPAPRDLLARAGEEARAGRLREALKLALQAAVLALRRAGALPSLPGLTDLEGVAILRERPGPGGPGGLGGREAFARLVEIHDRSVFARRGLDAATYDEAAALAASIVAEEEKELP